MDDTRYSSRVGDTIDKNSLRLWLLRLSNDLMNDKARQKNRFISATSALQSLEKILAK